MTHSQENIMIESLFNINNLIAMFNNKRTKEIPDYNPELSLDKQLKSSKQENELITFKGDTENADQAPPKDEFFPYYRETYNEKVIFSPLKISNTIIYIALQRTTDVYLTGTVTRDNMVFFIKDSV